jgi:hypothetical protein
MMAPSETARHVVEQRDDVRTAQFYWLLKTRWPGSTTAQSPADQGAYILKNCDATRQPQRQPAARAEKCDTLSDRR